MIQTDSALLTRQQLATRFLNCDPNTVERMAADGRIPAPINLGAAGEKHMLRWRRSDIEQWLEDGCPRGDPAPI